MNLLFPAMLVGTVGLLAPVILHLIARSRFPVRDFPTTRLLRYEKRDNVFAKKLVDPFQLLVRLLVLTLLVLAMARLFFPGASSKRAPRNLIVVLDASASMRMAVQDSVGGNAPTALDQAKRIASGLLREIDLPSRCSLVTVGDEIRVAGPLDPSPEAALAALPSIEPGDGAGPGLVRGVALSCQMLHGRREARSQIVALTDLRATAFQTRNQRDLQEIAKAQATLGEALEIIVVDVGAADADNVAIVKAQLRGGQAQTHDDAHVITRLRNTGSGEQTAKLTLTVGGKQEPPFRKLTLQPGEESVVHLTSRVRRSIRSFATVSLEEKDAVAHDNVYSVPFVVTPSRSVLIVNGAAQAGAGAEPSALALMGGESEEDNWAQEDVVTGARILQFALNPAWELGLRSGGTGVKTEVITPEVLSVQTLSNYDVLILYDVSTVPRICRRDLDTFVKGGRSLVFVCSAAARNGIPTLNAVEFNDCFCKAGKDEAGKDYGVISPARVGVDRAFDPAIGVRVSRSRGEENEGNVTYLPGPWLAPFKDQYHGGLSNISITRAREVLAVEDGANILLQGSGGEMLAVEATRGSGRVVLLSFGVELSQANIATTRVFAPLMWRLIDYQTGKLRLKPSDSLVAAQPAALDASEAAFSASEVLELVPAATEARRVALRRAPDGADGGEPGDGKQQAAAGHSPKGPGRRLLTITDHKTVMVEGLPTGHYWLRKKMSASGLGFTGGGSARPIAVNPDVRESDLARFGEGDVQKVFTTAARVVKPEETPGIAPAGAEAWPWVVGLLTMAYFAEAISAYVFGALRAKKLEAGTA